MVSLKKLRLEKDHGSFTDCMDWEAANKLTIGINNISKLQLELDLELELWLLFIKRTLTAGFWGHVSTGHIRPSPALKSHPSTTLTSTTLQH